MHAGFALTADPAPKRWHDLRVHPPALIIHGHFYQPPRENPWTGVVEREPSAAPAHDWNQRIHAECYRPNAWARIVDDRNAVAGIVNNYEALSFNFGPTLMSWLEEQHEGTYRRIIDADKRSVRARAGHGNAIAQGFNHAILPLCNDRDLKTQVRWGLAEFRHRYGRDAEALWMPETACDDRTLGVLIDHGLRYALLAPGQAARVKKDGVWQDVSDGSIDPRHPYRYLHPDGSGRSIALFFYDGALSRAVAFEGALASSGGLLDRFEAASAGSGSLVHVVTDGESYGHHFKFGDRCLAFALTREAERRGFWVTNYGELLDQHEPTWEVEVKAGDDGTGTAWSCAHGVGRWSRDCGCHTGGEPGWNQRWRRPLRDALDVLRDASAQFFESSLGDLFEDPWALRDAYVELVVDLDADRAQFLERAGGRSLGGAARVRALRLLESQRSAMLMYTSCGWFFNDLSGIETIQVLRYAARLIDQLSELGAPDPEPRFLEALAEARSNIPSFGTGADIYRQHAWKARVRPEALAAQVAIMSLPGEDDRAAVTEGELGRHGFRLTSFRKEVRGRIALVTAQIDLVERATTATTAFAACALHFGGVEMHCVLRSLADCGSLEEATKNIWASFERGSLLTLVRVAEEELGPEDYGLGQLLEGAREAVSRLIFEEMRERYAAQYEAMYQDARRAIAQFHEAELPVPDELRAAAGLALAQRFDEEIEAASNTVFRPEAYARARSIAEEARRYGCQLRHDLARAHFDGLLTKIMYRVCAGDTDVAHVGTDPTQAALTLLDLARDLGVNLDRERPQELLVRSLATRGPVSEPLRRLGRSLGLSDRLFEP